MSPPAHRRVAVSGVAVTAFGKLPDRDATALAHDALADALHDAGVTAADVDGLVTSRVPSYARLCELLAVNPRLVWPLPAHGRMSGVGIAAAAAAVADGRADVVALAYGNDGGSKGASYGGAGWDVDQSLWHAWGMTSPGAEHALLARRHMDLYGTTSEQLAAVSVAFRTHAGRNPGAVMRQPITVAGHQASRLIVDPLRLYDYCLINDGGVALVITTLERARAAPHPAVEILAWSTASSLRGSSLPPDDFWQAALRSCADEAYGQAGVGPADIDVAQIYDNFTPTVLLTLEGFGFCAPGEGGPFVQSGALELGGNLPTNTSGGHLSESYMQGWALNVEAVRQLRGELGARQVAGAEVAQYMAASPICSSIVYATPR